MQLILQYSYSAIIILIILLSVLFFANCVSNEKDKTINIVQKEKEYQKFAGSDKCISCHKNIYDTHIQTAHFLTSSVATAQSIKGSFDSGKNTFLYGNGSIMAMEKIADSFYQAGYINGIEKKKQVLI